MSDALAANYERDGVVFVPGALDEDSQALVARAFAYRFANLTSNVLDMAPAKGGIFITDLTSPAFWRSSEFADLIEKTPIVDIALACCGGEHLWFYYEQIFWKEGESRRTPWHQDSSYLPVDGKNMVRAWLTLDEIPAENQLELVRGSHRGPLHNASLWKEDDPVAGLYPEGRMPELPDIEADRSAFDIVSFDCGPGDIILFHPRTLHGGGSTSGHVRRRSISLMFFGDDARFDPRPIPDNSEIVGSFETERVAHLGAGEPFRLRDVIQVR